MASTDVLDSGNDQFKLASALMGNSTAFRVTRRAITFGSDANKTLTTSEYDGIILDVQSGTITTTRDLIVPLTTGALWIVRNNNAQSVRVIGSSGTGITIATTKTAIVACDGTNIFRVTADA